MRTLESLLLAIVVANHSHALVIEGRLPGERFREDNPPRFGALMSFTSLADSAVFLHGREVRPDYTIAQELKRIAKSLKLSTSAIERAGFVEGETRWLQYTFRKKDSGGFLYITRRDNWIFYLIIFNVRYARLSADLPEIERYLRQLRITEG